MVPGSSVKGKAGKGKNKRQVKGGNQQNVTSLSEGTRIKVAQILEQFQISNDEVYQFEDNLTNIERKAVHLLCRKMGMKSKSSGKGMQRRICVYKSKKGVDIGKGKENLVSFRFSEESKAVLQDLFSRYPPNDREMTENKVGESTGNIDKLAAKGDDMFCKPSMTQSEIANKVESLVSAMEKTPKLRQIAEQRSKLPIASFRDTITSMIDSHQVVLVCGETGCGKTTQVPQFLLDHAWSKGESCKIICTQPRRISATSVAERIASERGENVGDSVGYKIRLESKGGSHSSLVFCTNGVLLRVLVSKGGGRKKKKSSKKKPKGVFDITHIIVDEIHERDRYSDFMLPIIRDMLSSYPNLRLVLMSATIDAERFSEYFGGCPVIRVPGFTYPVDSFYLEDVLSIVKLTAKKQPTIKDSSSLTEEHRVALDEAIVSALSNDEFDPLLELISSEGDPEAFNYRHSKTGVTPLMVFAGKGRVGDICMLLSIGVDCHLRCNTGKTAFDYAEQGNQGEAAEIIKKHMEKASSEEEQIILDKYLSRVDPEHIDYMLIEQLLRRICNDSKDGAILVFLPGWDDINRTRERLVANPFFNDTSKFVIVSLHSMVPLAEQKKVFIRPPSGRRKIVLSTNIAETSLTIDDVVYVIDSGRMKEKNYDPYNNVSTLHSSWVSKASARQREGRAGRCQPGICYHLYSKVRAASLPDFQVPEIKRMPIEELCLQVKLIDPNCKIEDFLNKTLDPPVYETIRNAIVVLQDIGALSSDEKLTELGAKLGSLPVHPLTSKMLFLSILLNCLDPALTLACASDYRDPFVLPMLPDGRKRADAAKSELASFYGGKSDQLAVVAAFECWKMAKLKGEEARFCSQYFVNAGAMKMISLMRNKLQDELVRNGFIPKDTSRCSLNAQDSGILHAVIVGNLYPMVGRLITQGKRSVIETADGNKVRLHPHSTNMKLSWKKPDSQVLIVFDEVTRGDGGLIIRNCSVVGSLPLLLLAKEIAVAPNDDDDGDSTDDDSDEGEEDLSNTQHGDKIMSSPENIVNAVIDRWLPFQCKALEVAQIYCLRERLSAAILYKVNNPDKVLPEHLGASLYAIAGILSCDGMLGVPLPSDSVDSLATMVSAADIGNESNHGKKVATNEPPPGSYLKLLMYNGRRQYSASHHNRTNAPYHHSRPSVSTVGVNQVESESAHGAAISARGKVSKRPRGNGFR